MGLKELLLQRSGNLGNLTETVEVTAKAVSTQSGNLRNLSNLEDRECLEKTVATGGTHPENLSHDLLFSEVTKATEATALNLKANSGNLSEPREVTKVTVTAAWAGEREDVPLPRAPCRTNRCGPNPPAEGSLVQRLVAAGATVRTWSNGRGGQASIEAPAGISADLVAEVERRGWRIITGGKANPEAEHDSWAFGGVGIRELD